MQQQVRTALQEAKVIVFVVDGQQELTRVDEQLRDELFKYGKPVVVAVNKLDNERMEQNVYDFYALGFGDPHAISSGHGLGVDLLLDAVLAHLPEPSEDDEAEEEEKPKPLRVAIVGKPNVGKSSFVNAILNEERAIVTDVPGTTRDAIDIEFRWKDRDYVLVDTAGLRRKAGISLDVERFSVSRTLRAVKSADVALIMIDSTDGISEQDKRIIGFAAEAGTAMVLVWTKWDLVEDKEREFKKIPDEIDLKAPFIKYVPYLTISNLTRQRLFTVFEYVERVAAAAEKRIGTGELNRLMDELRASSPPTGAKGQAAKILYATQVSVKPTTFVLFVNRAKLFHFSYVRFIENRLRERYGFEGVPIKVELREGKPRE
jgi:GTP-binding protein